MHAIYNTSIIVDSILPLSLIMVRSKLNPDINYREYKQLERDDADYDACMYEIELLGKEVRIAIGRGKTEKAGIIYYPMYLINTDDRVSKQIGLFEIKADQASDVLDDDDDLDIDKLPHPSCIPLSPPACWRPTVVARRRHWNRNKFKKRARLKWKKWKNQFCRQSRSRSKTKTKTNQDQEKEGADALRSKLKALNLPAQTKDTALNQHAGSRKLPDEPWIQTHMQNSNFGITDNEAGGDCLFAVIREERLSHSRRIRGSARTPSQAGSRSHRRGA
jgi:hypothetical protein